MASAVSNLEVDVRCQGLLEVAPDAIGLLVTDMVIPQMLGEEVAERAVALRPEIKVPYMSGYAQPVLANRGTLEPGVVLTEKPFSEARLPTKVRDMLDSGPRD